MHIYAMYISRMFRFVRKAEDQTISTGSQLSIIVSGFTRGWTLQELLAPSIVVFYSQDGVRLGDKKTLQQQITTITGIAVEALRGQPLSTFSIEERTSLG